MLKLPYSLRRICPLLILLLSDDLIKVLSIFPAPFVLAHVLAKHVYIDALLPYPASDLGASHGNTSLLHLHSFGIAARDLNR